MQKCSYCGADLPEKSRFCGRCGSVQNAIATDAAATRSHTPHPQSWPPEGGTIPTTPYSNYPAQGSTPAWSPNVQVPTTPPPPPVADNEDERRRGIPPWPPLYDATAGGIALMGSGQAYSPGAPVVPGTPHIGSVPSVAGTPPSYTNAPVSHPTLGAGNAAPISHPISHPVQGTWNAAPINHPVQGTGNVPISHPIQPPHQPYPPPHQPPQQPGTQEHDPTHKHHGHHTHRMQHTATHATKAAGGSAVKAIILVVTAVVVVAAGGIAVAAHFLLHPQPLISITSNYKVGNALAGTNGTILHIHGQQFSSNSAITFLLDGHVAPGNSGTRSDSNGNLSANVTITAAWSVGTHTLTAKDASNDSTKNSVSVIIVKQGQANTPGPNGAPPDDASFKVVAQIQGSQSTETEIVTGHPDPRGGTVCQSEDTGQPIVITGFTTPGSVPYRKTSTYSCAGSYKGGKLTFTETLLSDVFVFSQSDGTQATCTLNSAPKADEQLSGSYTGNNTFSGTVTYPTIPDSDYPCTGGNYYRFHQGEQASWTGQVTDLHT